jgi:hypothetical protein
MLYVLLVVAIGWVLVRMWTSPVQVVALVLTMHGARQVAVAALPQFAASPFLINLAVAGLVAIALGLAAIRGSDALPPGTHHSAWGGSLAFYAYYFTYAGMTEAFAEESFSLLILRISPYILLQLFAMAMLVGASSPAEIRSSLASTWCICLIIVGIAVTDSSVRAGGDDSSFRLMLRTQQDETEGSNPLALADVGVMLMALTLHVIPGAARARFPSISRIGWLAGLISRARLVFIGALAVTILWISRAEPMLAVLAMGYTTFAARGGGRSSLIVSIFPIALLAIIPGIAQSTFGLLVDWFPRLGTLDEGVSIRRFLIEWLLDRYASGGFGVLLFGLGPGFSLANLGLYPHNHPVECLTELGIVGLAIAGIGPVTGWRRGATLLQSSPRGTAMQNAAFFQTMLAFSMLVSLKRGSVVHPDVFTWSAVLVFLHAAGSRADRAIDPTAVPPSIDRPVATNPFRGLAAVRPRQPCSPKHRHALA